MMNNTDATWEHKLSATLILIISIGVFVSVLIAPVFSQWQDDEEEIKALQNKIIHISKLMSEKQRLATHIESIRTSSSRQKGFLPTKVPSLAAAELQRQMISMVEEAGGQILSSQTMNEKVNDLYERISLNVRIKIIISDLRELLYRIESSTPYIFIDEIRISKSRRSAFAQASMGDLDVSFKISGYMQ